MDLKSPQNLYSGFYIDKALGNNAFSYTKRKQNKIYVAPLIEGTLGDLHIGDKIAFSEMENETEKNCYGLNSYLYFRYGKKDIFIFDNHNHAFFFWICGFLQNRIALNSTLLHIDQHKDMRTPEKPPPFTLQKELSLNAVFNYTNFELNVGNYIQPAMELGLYKKIEIIDGAVDFHKVINFDFILNIDMDIFSSDMAYISDDIKLNFIKAMIKKSNFITIATSPYFIEQAKAIDRLRLLLGGSGQPK